MKLELKHLAPYLPYGLKVKLVFAMYTVLPWHYEDKDFFELEGIMLDWYNTSHITKMTPILRQLSEWRSIEDGTQFLSPYFKELIDMDGGVSANVLSAPYGDIQLLLAHKFDVFGLIPAGLAIDINTL